MLKWIWRFFSKPFDCMREGRFGGGAMVTAFISGMSAIMLGFPLFVLATDKWTEDGILSLVMAAVGIALYLILCFSWWSGEKLERVIDRQIEAGRKLLSRQRSGSK